MSIKLILKKVKREFFAGFSKIYLKYVKTNYLGLKLKVPIFPGFKNGCLLVAKELWMSKCLKTFTALKEGCVVDIGVNVGLYLVKLKAVSKNITYFGVDANSACTFYTQELIRINKFKNSHVFTLALGEKTEVKDFYVTQHADQKGSFLKENVDKKGKEHSFKTFILKGDDFINSLKLNESISAIKIDVEGVESFILNGLENTIKKHKPFIYCEIFNNKTKEHKKRISSILNLLKSSDYVVLGVLSKDKKLEKISSSEEISDKYLPEYIFCPNNLLDKFLETIGEYN